MGADALARRRPFLWPAKQRELARCALVRKLHGAHARHVVDRSTACSTSSNRARGARGRYPTAGVRRPRRAAAGRAASCRPRPARPRRVGGRAPARGPRRRPRSHAPLRRPDTAAPPSPPPRPGRTVLATERLSGPPWLLLRWWGRTGTWPSPLPLGLGCPERRSQRVRGNPRYPASCAPGRAWPGHRPGRVGQRGVRTASTRRAGPGSSPSSASSYPPALDAWVAYATPPRLDGSTPRSPAATATSPEIREIPGWRAPVAGPQSDPATRATGGEPWRRTFSSDR